MISCGNYTFACENFSMVVKSRMPSPLVISVPHDRAFVCPDFEGFFMEREYGRTGRDWFVWPVVKDLFIQFPAQAIRGLLPRNLCDYNRGWPIGINYDSAKRDVPERALEDVRLAPAYAFYHKTIQAMLCRAKTVYRERALLIDCHGFSNQPPYASEGGFDLIFGTGNRKTIYHGDIDRRLARELRGRGYQVFLPEEESIGPAEDLFAADFTTRHHAQVLRCNAIQIEIAKKFRVYDARELGKKLSKDLAECFRALLPS